MLVGGTGLCRWLGTRHRHTHMQIHKLFGRDEAIFQRPNGLIGVNDLALSCPIGRAPHIETHSLSLNPWGQISQPWPLELIERFLHQTLEAAALFCHLCVRVKKLWGMDGEKRRAFLG